jgi:hypothetical protein
MGNGTRMIRIRYRENADSHGFFIVSLIFCHFDPDTSGDRNHTCNSIKIGYSLCVPKFQDILISPPSKRKDCCYDEF